MATKTKDKKKKQFTIRTVKSKEDRKRPSVFMRLKTDEAFKGIALFEPDPELADNPGYFEYYDHYDKQGNAYVPCTGDKCPFCAANDNPSTRALTVWLFPQEGDKKDRVKVFTMNYSTTQDISDESEDEEGILGKWVRIKRLSDKGDYRVKVTSDKPLTKKELTAAMKELEEKFPDGLQALVEKQLSVQMERLKALEAMEDDDEDEDEDDEEETTSKARRGKAKSKDDDEDEEEDDEEEDEDDDEDDEDEENEDDEEDEDEDEDESEDEEGEDEGDDEVTEISGVVYEITKINQAEETFDLKNDEEKVKMWLGDGVEVDYDEIKKGVEVKVDAATDDEGDWIITSIALNKKRGGKQSGKKTSRKK